MKLDNRLLTPLSFQGSMPECFPRMLWQRLFDVYWKIGGSLNQLDNLLVDYENCCELFKNRKLPITFFWSCYQGHWSTHWRYEKEDPLFMDGDVLLEVSVTPTEAKFTEHVREGCLHDQ